MKYILFDLDGTLTDPKEGITRCVQYALEKSGIEPPAQDKLTCFIGPPLIDSFMKYYNMTREEAVQAVEKYRERFSSVGLFENKVFDGIENMLSGLKKSDMILAVSTSKPEVYAKRILDKFELSKYFNVITGSNLDGTRTDKAEVIGETLRRLELTDADKGEVLMVGDRMHDIIGAKRCGIKSLGVYFGYAEPGELEEAGADMICNTVGEVTHILKLNLDFA